MKEHKTKTLHSYSPQETKQFAAHMAEKLQGGEVIELVSDLGGGKTTFTQGLVQELGSKDTVASPTFTISREYAGGRLHVYHFDFYRLHEAGIVADELAEVIEEPKAVIVVEWGDVVQNVLPARRVRITIAAESENERKFVCHYPAELSYVLEGL